MPIISSRLLLAARQNGPTVSLMVLVFLLCMPYVIDLGSVDLVGGEPRLHALNQQHIASELSKRSERGDILWPAFANAYYIFPKIVNDIVNGAVLFLLFDAPYPLDKIKYLWAIECTAMFFFLLACSVFTYRALFKSWPVALAGATFVLVNHYYFLYASFPRQNMIAHALTALVFCVYVLCRYKSAQLDRRIILALGVLAGIATLTHYSSIHIVYFLIACELALVTVDGGGGGGGMPVCLTR
ncbi:MAG: hypothetical protein HQK87_02965 [Nitrospinae bacterium]|nr:hypothetical protein [Nitrospinota bacterium]